MPRDREPVGSGPYRLAKHVLGTQIDLEAVDAPHWRVDPKWDKLVFLNIPEASTRLAMLETGRADVTLIASEQIADAEKRGLRIFPSNGQAQPAIMFGGQFTPDHPEYKGKEPWQDIRVREAMNIAIDRRAINKTFYANQGTYEPLAGSNVAPPTTVAKYPITYDPERAKRLLKEAGADGFAPEIVSYAFPGFPQTPQVLEAVAGYWEAVGLKPKIKPMDFLAFRELWVKDKTNGLLWFWAMGVGGFSASGFEKFFYSKALGFKIYADAYLDSIYDQLKTIGEPAKRESLFTDAQVYLRQKWAAIPLCNVPNRIFAAAPKKVGSWTPTQLGDRTFWEYLTPA